MAKRPPAPQTNSCSVRHRRQQQRQQVELARVAVEGHAERRLVVPFPNVNLTARTGVGYERGTGYSQC